MYVYDCNAFLTTEMKNISDKEMIRAFKPWTEDLKSQGIHPGLHFMDKKSSTDLKRTMTIKNIKYQLVPPRNHRSNNKERAKTTFKNHFIAGLWSVEFFLSSITRQNITAGNNQSKPDQETKNPSPHLILYSHLQIIWFQPHTFIPTWHKSIYE